MLLNLTTREWIAVSQRGWRPEPRWASAIAYYEPMQQLYIFGGTGASGSCRNDVYCCELNPDRVKYQVSKLTSHIHDVEQISKRMIYAANQESMME